MNVSRSSLLIQGLLLVAMALGPGCANRSEQVTIALPATSLNFSAVYVAADMGFWKDAGANVTSTRIGRAPKRRMRPSRVRLISRA